MQSRDVYQLMEWTAIKLMFEFQIQISRRKVHLSRLTANASCADNADEPSLNLRFPQKLGTDLK